MAKDLITVIGEEGTFEEQVIDLAALLSRSIAPEKRDAFITSWREKATAAGEEAEGKRSVMKELVASLNGIGEGNDRELEGFFNLVSAIVASLFSDEEVEPLVKELCAAIVKEGQAMEKTIVRYRILTNIYNSLPATSSNRYLVFTTLLELASSNDELDLLADALTALPSRLAVWNIDAAKKSGLLASAASALESADQGQRAYQFHLAHLRFLSTSSVSGAGSDSAEAKAAAEKTIVAALRLPKLFDFEELVDIDAVKQLSGQPVGKLLDVFVKGNTADWDAWKGAHSSDVDRLGLSVAQLDRKIRLMDLAALCSRSVSSEVPYTAIASALGINVDDVEVWVIDVIRAGLVSGKLSQVKQSLRVYRSAYRTFGREQWETLEVRLSQWESSINAILETLQETKRGVQKPVPANVGIPGADAGAVNQITA
ncbi:hypothetical protein FA10DRAFT_249168 [Acaromyces ingoldii]|uniref:Eukaryotic translation initiation factor 3 subunit M n=1 Tax=Acaromyces ingoldii TaxID=215250 RepID=A0A316YY23_9BASI|nr:hypothetical protein FA10DRAFT_249168 [Acaromyces ingoldii]PWN94410.1 hypothetical protein FA10DRAFT_249168 [Acaromyces ingoldii]